MPDWLLPFLVFGAITFFITGFILLVFPVEVYFGAKQTDWSDANKGRFAKTAYSLEQVKHYGLSADGEYWWHLFWFNSAVSASVATLLTFGAMLLVGIILIALVLLVLRIAISG